MIDLPNLDKCKSLMSVKSTSDYSECVGAKSQLDMSDASGCLAYINVAYPNHNKGLAKQAVNCYVCDDDSKDLQKTLEYMAMGVYSKKGQKHVKNAVAVACQSVLQGEMTDSEKAVKMGVKKNNYAMHHKSKVELLESELTSVLAMADSVGGEYWRMHYLTK